MKMSHSVREERKWWSWVWNRLAVCVWLNERRCRFYVSPFDSVFIRRSPVNWCRSIGVGLYYIIHFQRTMMIEKGYKYALKYILGWVSENSLHKTIIDADSKCLCLYSLFFYSIVVFHYCKY